jgi:Flp pilus assembly protein TadG
MAPSRRSLASSPAKARDRTTTDVRERAVTEIAHIPPFTTTTQRSTATQMRRIKTRRNDKGQAVVEFVLVLPILAMVLFGIIQFGITFNNYVTLTDATRAGARKAAVSRSAADPGATAEQAVRDSAASLNEDDLDVAVSASPGWTSGSEVTVTATYPYEISLMGIVIKSGNLESSTKERVE